jgi:hypothetical protein
MATKSVWTLIEIGQHAEGYRWYDWDVSRGGTIVTVGTATLRGTWPRPRGFGGWGIRPGGLGQTGSTNEPCPRCATPSARHFLPLTPGRGVSNAVGLPRDDQG